MNKRQTQILDMLTVNHQLKVTELSSSFDVSQVTIRKDLTLLQKEGIIVYEHGYATLNDSNDINARLAYHYENKQRIAVVAAQSISNGETVMIESGSCCALVALEIARTKKDVTIITNSAFIANYIRKLNTVKTILLGGEYQNDSQAMVGPITRMCAGTFHVDKFFVGTDGFIKETGFMGNDYMRNETARDLSKQANRVIIVTDSIKFSKQGISKLFDIHEVMEIITDNGIPSVYEDYFIKSGISITKA